MEGSMVRPYMNRAQRRMIRVRRKSTRLRRAVLGSAVVGFMLIGPTSLAADKKAQATIAARIRSEPSTESKILTVIYPGERVTVLEKAGNWTYVEMDDTKGYILSKLLTDVTSKTEGEAEKEAAPESRESSESSSTPTSSKGASYDSVDAKKLRANAGIMQRTLLKRGAQGEKVVWFQQALMLADCFLGPANGDFDEETESAIKRFQAARDLLADGEMGKDTITALFDMLGVDSSDFGGWSGSGSSGASGGSTSASSGASGGSTSASSGASGGSTSASSGSSTSASSSITQVAAAPQGITGTPINAVSGAVQSLDPGGEAGGYPVPIDSGASAASEVPGAPISSGAAVQGIVAGVAQNIELLEWYGEGKAAFTRNTPARVYDTRSGKSYYVTCFSAGNHADVVPTTREDTQILLETYGYEWSWDPRPVFVTVSGRTFVGSINGMPHGTTPNLENGMDGQVCIHLLGSKTHNGNTSFEKEHQNAVYEAWEAAKRMGVSRT